SSCVGADWISEILSPSDLMRFPPPPESPILALHGRAGQWGYVGGVCGRGYPAVTIGGTDLPALCRPVRGVAEFEAGFFDAGVPYRRQMNIEQSERRRI